MKVHCVGGYGRQFEGIRMRHKFCPKGSKTINRLHGSTDLLPSYSFPHFLPHFPLTFLFPCFLLTSLLPYLTLTYFFTYLLPSLLIYFFLTYLYTYFLPYFPLTCWSLRLSEFDFEIEHVTSSKINHVDALSRHVGLVEDTQLMSKELMLREQKRSHFVKKADTEQTYHKRWIVFWTWMDFFYRRAKREQPKLVFRQSLIQDVIAKKSQTHFRGPSGKQKGPSSWYLTSIGGRKRDKAMRSTSGAVIIERRGEAKKSFESR